jgi:hypothetical protein
MRYAKSQEAHFLFAPFRSCFKQNKAYHRNFTVTILSPWLPIGERIVGWMSGPLADLGDVRFTPP